MTAAPARGLGIALVDVRPAAVKVGMFRGGSGATQYTGYEVKCEVTYGVSFFRDGVAQNVTAKAVSRGSTSLAEGMGPACADGLAVMYGDIRARFAAFVAGK